MEGDKHIYLFMTDEKYEYCLYRIKDPGVVPYVGEDESAVQFLEEPLLKMKKSKFAWGASFVSIGSRIFGIGGCFNSCPSNKVFIYDTLYSTLVRGPKLNSGKRDPYLFTLGSKIFALSRLMYCSDPKNSTFESEPRFEMLDADDLQSKWSALPLPVFDISWERLFYFVDAAAIVSISDGSSSSDIIVISVEDIGTYTYDVEKRVWKFVGVEVLPFSGHGVSIPHDSSMCYAYSLKSKKHSGFRFRYVVDESKRGLEIDEIDIDDCVCLSPLWPPLVDIHSMPMIFVPGGKAYYIATGVDESYISSSGCGNRYVKVYAYEFSDLKLGKKKKQLRHGKDQDETGEVELDERLWSKRFGCNKRRAEHDEEEGETVEDALNKEQPLKRSRKKKKNGQMGDIDEQNRNVVADICKEPSLKRCMNKKSRHGVDEKQDKAIKVDNEHKGQSSKKLRNKNTETEYDQEKDETVKLDLNKELRLTSLWGMCFSGGMMCDPYTHVAGAIVM